ncbi:Gfo/Idh/MocA family oxidoreductase [Paenibacillus koleovorans]|uniref:Gfo/Idh/MocA family oxidoreductase n=1 Tax=Paenibacillus koleovorans TaxID=121608 RepID=UPI000FD76B7A|nr:Gfo/Idh/MocA family oxidoreductase [Paenibacillus koleovorans]
MKRYAIAGTGARARYMFALPIVQTWKDTACLTGLYDPNRTRAQRLSEECGGIPVFTSFDAMLAESRPDTVIVATIDSMHHDYIIRAMQAGCDVISEKPLTIDADKCRAILKAERDTGRQVIVTFNARYNPYVTRIKELLVSGAIGRVTHVHFEWSLDLSHGADYYRRWHRRLEHSGGLLVHKSTHHFDVINWWLDQEPEEVYAYGDRHFYGPTRQQTGIRCTTCAYSEDCEFYLDLERDPILRAYYKEGESEDGYMRDACVFSEEIDIYDTMSLNVKYKNRTTLNYSLLSYSPFEGWRATLHGTKGRLQAEVFTSGSRADDPYNTVTLYDHAGGVVMHPVKKRSGGHGGSDSLLQRMLFQSGSDDPLGQQAGSRAGALSLCVGAAANISIAERRPVSLGELLQEEMG